MTAHRTPHRTPDRTGKTRTSTGTARAHGQIRVRMSDTRMCKASGCVCVFRVHTRKKPVRPCGASIHAGFARAVARAVRCAVCGH